MRKMMLAALPLLAGCASTTAQLAAKPPFKVVQSSKAREAVTNCLLDRLASQELIPTRDTGATATTLSFNGLGLAMKPAIYLFVIRDQGGGSIIEVRRYAGANLAAAETCF